MAKKKVTVAEIIRSGEAITVPEKMKLETAAEILIRQAEHDQQQIEIIESFPGYFIWDAARAFNKAMQDVFGYAASQRRQSFSFFGPKSEPPREITVETGWRPKDREQIPFGQFTVPLIDGTIEMHQDHDGSLLVLIKCKRLYEGLCRDVCTRTQELLRAESIYRGKAVRIEYGNGQLPKINFMQPPADVLLILPRMVEHALDSSVWTPIRHSQKCRDMMIPLKRTVLLHGTYGTGKTLAATITADIATHHGWTFVYVTKARDLAQAYKFAMNYAPAVLFVEDCDRSLQGERTENIDAILNTVDGIDSKDAEILLIMTTNNADRIPNAMRRPGRIDACIEVSAPDQEAVGRLIEHYARGRLEGSTAQAQELLAGQIPAVVRETVERAKLYAIASGRDSVNGDDVNLSAESMLAQVKFINAEQSRPETDAEIVTNALARAVITDDSIDRIIEGMKEQQPWSG